MACFQFFVWWVSQMFTNLVQATTVGVPLPTRRTELTITSNDEISSKHKALTSNLQNWKHRRKHQSTHFATPQLCYHFLGGRADLTITSNDEISSKHKALSSNLQNWKHRRNHQSTHFATFLHLKVAVIIYNHGAPVSTSFSKGWRTGLWPVFNFVFDGLVRFLPTWYRPPQLGYHFLQGGQNLPSHPMMKYHQNIRP